MLKIISRAIVHIVPARCKGTAHHSTMRVFRMYRKKLPANHINTGKNAYAEGVVFSDGTVAVRWIADVASHSIWTSLADFQAIHGHPEYGTVWEWYDIGDKT